ncbi:MAG: FAD-dependent monooxygenase [Bacteroidota bacterium]
MAKDNRRYEVIIIGGGPAGIATALTLSARGISSCLLEARPAPFKKVGEALPPNARPLLRQLGIEQLLTDPKHQVYHGNLSCWGNSLLEEKDFIREIHGHGYLLDRLHFERQLWELLDQSKTDFIHHCQIQHINPEEKGVEVVANHQHQTITTTGNFIVDATGRKASVCRKLGAISYTMDQQFGIACQIALPARTASQIMVEATPNGWWYAAPAQTGELTLMFFTLKEMIGDEESQKKLLRRELRHSIHLKKRLPQGIPVIDQVKIMPAGTSCLEKPYGKNWLAVGDAAYAYDPISSYGITSALASGFYAGNALAASLAGEEDALDVYRYVVENAFQAYMSKLSRHYALEQRWPDSAYWQNRLKNIQTL